MLVLMESHQQEMLQNSSVVSKPEKPYELGVLEVYIHQARDIHNICIYHKQDVYAKITLTSDPETAVSTKIINGGGKNPIFNESLRLNVRTIDSSLKCEIWMLSRVRNYLEDQLLGVVLVPLSDVVIGSGKVEQEFSLSSSDLFHSPAGFVQLTVTYTGSSPEVLGASTPSSSTAVNLIMRDSEVPICVPNELDMIEFLDPNIASENEMMVSEYFEIPCANLETTFNGKNRFLEEASGEIGEGSSGLGLDSVEVSKVKTPPNSVSTTSTPPTAIQTSSQLPLDSPGASKPVNQDFGSSLKEKIGDADSALSVNDFEVNVEPKREVVQQYFVDMYMKSMQEFTESLAKMKLPLDVENGSADSEETGSDEKGKASKSNGPSPRVFYGSRAFF